VAIRLSSFESSVSGFFQRSYAAGTLVNGIFDELAMNPEPIMTSFSAKDLLRCHLQWYLWEKNAPAIYTSG
jgi:hypothetical protein